MSEEKVFRIATRILIVCLVISAFLHIFLYASDSDSYRRLVTVQILLQFVGVGLLWYVQRYSLIALSAFTVLSLPFLYISAFHTNYGHLITHLISILLFWVIYGSLIYRVRNRFFETS